jgi:hypothetical protein
MSNGQQVKRRNGYVADLKQLATVCASGDTVEISGFAGSVTAASVRPAVPRSSRKARSRAVTIKVTTSTGVY